MVSVEPYRITVNGDSNTIYIDTKGPDIAPIGNIEWTIIFQSGFKIRGNVMSFVLPDDKNAALSITPVDAHGHPAVVEGVPVWSVSDETLLTLVTAEDGMSATISAVGPLGSAQVNVVADADVGEGNVPITGILDIEIAAGTAAGLQINAAIVNV